MQGGTCSDTVGLELSQMGVLLLNQLVQASHVTEHGVELLLVCDHAVADCAALLANPPLHLPGKYKHESR